MMNEAGNRVHGTAREESLNRFADVESSLLAALLDVALELAVWAKLKVDLDANVQVH